MLSQLLVSHIPSSSRNELATGGKKGRYKRPVSLRAVCLTQRTFITNLKRVLHLNNIHLHTLDEHPQSQHPTHYRTSGAYKPCPGTIDLPHPASPARWSPSDQFFTSNTSNPLIANTTSQLHDNKRCSTQGLFPSQRDRIHPADTTCLASPWMD